MPPDLTSLLHALRTTDAAHDPAEANALMSAAVHDIERLRTMFEHFGDKDPIPCSL